MAEVSLVSVATQRNPCVSNKSNNFFTVLYRGLSEILERLLSDKSQKSCHFNQNCHLYLSGDKSSIHILIYQ